MEGIKIKRNGQPNVPKKGNPEIYTIYTSLSLINSTSLGMVKTLMFVV